MAYIKIEKEVEFDLDGSEVAGALSYEDALRFIKDIDQAYGDWDFTLKLVELVEEMKKEAIREGVEDFDKYKEKPPAQPVLLRNNLKIVSD